MLLLLVNIDLGLWLSLCYTLTLDQSSHFGYAHRHHSDYEIQSDSFALYSA